mgnify:CR=1 FL=1|jgi:hypothetical protein
MAVSTPWIHSPAMLTAFDDPPLPSRLSNSSMSVFCAAEHPLRELYVV